MNSEFHKFFPLSDLTPILRNVQTNKYWINENLLKVKIGKNYFNIAESIIEIINQYTKVKLNAFESFIDYCEQLKNLESDNDKKIIKFINELIANNADARIFEIVSFAILKYYYHDQVIYWGFDKVNLIEENLNLYKTGRTNANDGGIDFVMKPLGRFFQVTETLDVKKYFLDIEKIEKFPITFVIKSELSPDDLILKLKDNAKKIYLIESVVEKYINCIEEIINNQELLKRFDKAVEKGFLFDIFEEIILQSKVEFNYNFEK